MNINEIFQKRLPEDLVEYYLYIIDNDNSNLSVEDLRTKCLAIYASIAQDYIWNFEGFNLTVRLDNSLPHLYGSTNFGDFIEDEWLCVFVLREISKQIPEVVCRICDNDGEFLLIEAAEHIPRWLTPDTASNRVFMHRGMLHIIPNVLSIAHFPNVDFTKPACIETAIQVVSEVPWLTQAHANILNCIEERIQRFSHDLLQYVQHVNVFIPRAIACILDTHPHFISYAIRSFCYRDPLELRACRIFSRFKPQDRVWTQVAMNRCSYAQLMQENFTPDNRSGFKFSKNLGMDFKGHDLGCKITHGFEMLCSRFRERKKDKNIQEIDLVLYQRYLDSLKDLGYFRGEIEGSKLYQKLTESAKLFYEHNLNNDNFLDDENVMQSNAYRIHSVYNTIDGDTKITRLKVRTSQDNLPLESSTEWMYLTDEGIDDLVKDMNIGFKKLNKKHSNDARPQTQRKHMPGSENDDPPLEEVENLNKLSTKMKEFVNKFSDYEGVEQNGQNQDEIQFDFNGFSQALEGMLDGNSRGESEETSDDEFLSSGEQDSDDEEMEGYMQEMDEELSETKVGKSFLKSGSDEPLDLDLNLVQNFLESHSSAMGLHGPTESLLQSIGVSLPNNTD